MVCLALVIYFNRSGNIQKRFPDVPLLDAPANLWLIIQERCICQHLSVLRQDSYVTSGTSTSIRLPGHGIRTVVAKIAWDQILFSPVCIAACLLVAGRLENKTSEHLLSQTVQLGARLYIAECLIWPPAQFINFYYLPTKYRVLYDNIISLVYDVYTSHVKHQVAVRDNFFQELETSQLVPRPAHFFEATEHLIDVTENMFDDDGR